MIRDARVGLGYDPPRISLWNHLHHEPSLYTFGWKLGCVEVGMCGSRDVRKLDVVEGVSSVWGVFGA